MKRYYRVANLIFSLEMPDEDRLNGHISNYEPFIVSPDKLKDFDDEEILFELLVEEWDDEVEHIAAKEKEMQPIIRNEEPDKIIWIYRKSVADKALGKYTGDYSCHYFTKLSKYDNFGVLQITDSFKRGVLKARGTRMARQFALNNALMMLFAFAGAGRGALLQHASVIKLDGKGYCFLGVSGTGKSTHSQLWLDNIKDTELLNDDNPAIRFDKEGVPFVFGTPWSGKTPCYKNERAVLGGFVNLKQAPHNKIKKLSVISSYAALLPTFSNLKWERYIADGINNTIENLIKRVNVFELENLPNAEAANLSYSALTSRVADGEVPIASNDAERPKTAKGYELFDTVAEMVNEDVDESGKGKIVQLKVRGNSMLPFIFNGRDSVKLQRRAGYSVGDIVLAHYRNMYILHRIIGLDGDIAYLRGDGNLPKKIEKIPVSNIVAKVVEIFFNGKSRNPDAALQKFKYRIWEMLLPLRRILLGIYRRMPYYKKYTRLQREEDKKKQIIR